MVTLKNSKMSYVAWQNVCKPKQEGGLGIRSMQKTNISMLSKLGWRLTHETGSPWTEAVKAKYLTRNRKVWDPCSSNVSYTWRWIKKGDQLIKDGMKWIKNGFLDRSLAWR